MTDLKQVYRCEVCGNIVEVLHTGVGELVCCNEPMKMQKENTVDAAKEKHIPVIEKEDDSIVVKVGSVPHPTEEEHYIEWIEFTMSDGKTVKTFLKPGDKPEVKLCDCSEDKCACGEVRSARAYCNLHGLWSV